MTALNYIRQKGFEHRMQGGQIVLRECPFCHDTGGHFYQDPAEDGLYFCHKCGEKGNLITLQKHLGDYEVQRAGGNGSGSAARKPQGGVKQAFAAREGQSKVVDEKLILQAHERLLADPQAMSYLQERKITPETAKAFKLGLKVDPDGTRWLTIPHYAKGKVLNVKSRSLPPAERAFRRIKDCPSILFNGDCIEQFPEIHICEGEIDALTLWAGGVKNVVGVTGGAGFFHPSWIDQLAKMDSIFLLFDPDEAGQKGAREAARRLGFNRCYNVVLPDGQDVNDYFQTHSVRQFRSLAMDSRPFDVAGVISIEDGLEKFRAEIKRPEDRTGLLTPWPSVNRLIKTGFQPGELVVLSAPPKIGKSTWALQVASFQALQEIPSLFFCLEMRPMKILEKVIQSHTGVEILGPHEIEKARRAFSGKPFYLGYCYQRPDLNGILETIKAAIQRYGLKLVVFDHLHFLCRSITNQTQEIGLAVQAFKFLAEEMEVPIILIAQPRKIQEGAIMGAMDLKDSISIYSDCDHLIILHRKKRSAAGKDVEQDMETQDQAFDPITLVRVEASRYNAGGEALLYYHGEYSRFDEVQKTQREEGSQRDLK